MTEGATFDELRNSRSTSASANEKGVNMPYYVKLSTDIKGLFGAGATTTSIVNSLTSDGISARRYDVSGAELPVSPEDFKKLLKTFDNLGLEKQANKVLFDSKFALLLGTDQQSRQQIGADLMQYWGDEVDEIALRVPRYKEWLACVTFVEPAARLSAFAPPTEFQVVALVGSSALQAAQIGWTQEDKPGQLWATHVEPSPIDSIDSSSKMVRDVKAFTGRGRWF
jgi:hypothetical protein